MNQVDYAVRLNNEAVSLLLAGNDQQAVECLTKSVSLMKRVLARATSHGAPSPSSSSGFIGLSTSQSSRASGPISPSSASSVDSSICIHHASSSLAGLADRQCYIYNQALTISNMDCDGVFSSSSSSCHIESYAQVYSAVIIFNMALAHHRGRRNGNKKCAERAIVLYNMIMRLLRHSGTSGTAGVVKFATINNLSQLRFEQGHYSQAREGLDYLSTLMLGAAPAVTSPAAVSSISASTTTTTTSAGHIDQANLEKDDIRGLIMNVLFVNAPKIAPAA